MTKTVVHNYTPPRLNAPAHFEFRAGCAMRQQFSQ
eukprot:CAMPEP_0119363728 /NCGR_PEP_ID=MMETSP1334-20130426/10665_1 /TAXON_ID=127549 /ORGANISM="Calcidiscus leptoporus, Strain RCC1130" /LENGTH=34 /DNA_ID= /DNA_START= /DNA_END= /DNA_ORIENTATION=